jgi:hypothetical protein
MTELIIFTIVISLILAGIGFRLQAGTKQEIALRRQAKGWPTTPGAVTGGRVVRHKRSLTQLGGGAGLRVINLDRFEPEITYTYQVEGVEYSSSKFRSGMLARRTGWADINPKQAEKIVDEHPAGQAVTVTYNPADPAQAYLEIDAATGGQQAFRIGGFVMFAAAAVLLVVGGIRVIQNLGVQSAAAGTPPGVPQSTAAIKGGLERELQLACQSANAAGKEFAYTRWECEKKTADRITYVSVFSRKAAPEVVDSVRTQGLNFDQAEELALLSAIAKIAAPAADPRQVQDWLAKTKPTLAKTGSTAETTIGGVKFTYSNPYGMNTLLEIGAIR